MGALGADGAVGVTELDAAEGALVPTPFVAVTVKVYAVPFVRPVTIPLVAGGEPVTLFVMPPGLDVIVYEVIGLPLAEGAVHETVACASPAAAVTPVGAFGAVGVGGTAA